ncbi:MAG: hypothetical protein J6Z23_06835, partial [Lachnospiraceae bacterium]|nr:hypothetical protein [Lachnospiraceae bacterium]
MPQGTYTIREVLTEAQQRVFRSLEGVNTVTEGFRITEENASAGFVFSIENALKRGTVRVAKRFPEGAAYSGVRLAGFLFRLHGTSDAGTAVDVALVTDAEGKASAEGIPYGTYTVEEVLTEAQARYWVSKSAGTVVVSDETPDVTYTLENEQRTGGVRIQKSLPGDAFYAGVIMEGIRFHLYGTTELGSSGDLILVT